MGRKQRVAKRQTRPLEAAFLHRLLADDLPVPSTRPHRLDGWPDALMLSTAELRALWTEHREALTTEARAAGFVPWAAVVFDHAADSPASQTARRVWSQSFHAEHGY